MTALQDSPTLADVELALGEWIGEIIPGLDLALAQVGDGDWSPGTREAVLRWVGHEIMDQFTDGTWQKSTCPDDLNNEARLHLARYAVARSRAARFESRLHA